MATNEVGYRRLIAENSKNIFTLGTDNIIMLDKETFVGFFDSEKDAKEFAATQNKTTSANIYVGTGDKWTIRYDNIKEINYPVFGTDYSGGKGKGQQKAEDTFSFTIKTTDMRSITFNVSSKKSKNKDLDRYLCYEFFSQLLVRCRLFYRRHEDTKINMASYKKIVFAITLLPLFLSSLFYYFAQRGTIINESLVILVFLASFVIPVFVINSFLRPHRKQNKFFFTSDKRMATPEENIFLSEEKRKIDFSMLWIFLVIAALHFISVFWFFYSHVK